MQARIASHVKSMRAQGPPYIKHCYIAGESTKDRDQMLFLLSIFVGAVMKNSTFAPSRRFITQISWVKLFRLWNIDINYKYIYVWRKYKHVANG